MTCKQFQFFGLALGALLLAPSADSTAQSRTRTQPSTARCYRIDVSSPELPSTRRRRRPSFSAAEIMDLELQAYVSKRMTGRHSLELKVYTPQGNLYQSMKLQFDADVPNESRQSGQSGQKDAEDRSRGRYQTVSTVLPVAGTSIVSSSMYGTWKIEAFLDGAEKRCSQPTSFVIEP